MNRPELLAPAGNLEKLKIAVLYGADAVYCGGFNFGLRAGADNFSEEDLRAGADFAHQQGTRIYVTVNMIPHNDDLKELPDYLHKLEEIAVDGIIVSDPGVMRIADREGISIPLHLSTQANAVNWQSVLFWQELGLERIILARELSRQEVNEIKDRTDIELEMFIHGAMCVSYSGRCLLSNYLTGRDANRGRCAHPCRWQYHLVEEKRPGEYYPVIEDSNGTHILNSRDLCLIEHIPQIVESGVDSLKIEGRMKGLHYTAAVTTIYRRALDQYLEKGRQNYHFNPDWLEELKKISHRPYTTGFFVSEEENREYTASSVYRSSFKFVGVVHGFSEGQIMELEVRNKIEKSDRLEVLTPAGEVFSFVVERIVNSGGEEVDSAPHPGEIIKITAGEIASTVNIPAYSLLRREKTGGNKHGK